MFKKLKKWFLLGLLTITSGALIGTGISLANEDMTQTLAVNMSGGEVLYLKPNSNWKQASARFAAYFFGSGNTWVDMTECENDEDIYKVTAPAGSWTNVIFCRMNPSTTENNWNGGVKWNQTGDLAYDGTNNLYTVKEDTWDSGGGTWSSFTETEKLFSVPSGTPVYLEPTWGDVAKSESWTIEEAKFAIYVFKINGGDAWSGLMTEIQKSQTTMYETVIPEGGPWDKIIAVRLKSTATTGNWDDKLNDQTSNISFGTEFNAESTIKITITGWADENYKVSNDFSHSSRAYCFSDYLISETESICENWETNSNESYKTTWSNLQSQYNNMSSQSKALLKTAQADKEETKDSIKIAMARYDHIVAKYGLNNFLERESSLQSRLFGNSINSNNSTLIIVLASITAIGLISVLFITFKRKRA